MIKNEKILKNLSIISLSFLLSLTFCNKVYADEIAKPTTQKILLNSEEVKCEVYNINGSNYFKLRDVAAILNGTAAQFCINYDGDIHITTNNEYIFVGNEMTPGKNEDQIAMEATSTVYVNGTEFLVDFYKINGNNYFPIRYLGHTLNFDVDFISQTNTVILTAGEILKFEAVAINENDSNNIKKQKFNAYVESMKDAQSSIKKVYSTIKKSEGKSKDKKQIYAYIALDSWITEKKAKNLLFAKLDEEKLKEKYNIQLPKIEGTLEDGKSIKSSYYLTSDGNIFVYPPYEYNLERYVNNKVKIKLNDIAIGKVEFNEDDIWKSRQFTDMPIFIEENAEIEMTTSFNTNLALDNKQVLEFSVEKNGYPGISLIVRDKDLRSKKITADITYVNKKIMDINELHLYREENYSNIYTNQLYIDKQYHNEVLAINFYADGELIASGKIKLI